MDGVQLSQGYRATTRRQFTFYHSVPRSLPTFSLDQPWKDEKLSQPWSHRVVLNLGPLDWESSALTTTPGNFASGRSFSRKYMCEFSALSLS